MEHPSKRRRLGRNLGGLVEGFNLNKGRERSVSLGGSIKNEQPMMPKLVLPPHGAPGHPAHGDPSIDDSRQDVEGPHYPLENADSKPKRVHARQIVQPSATDAASAGHRTSEAIPSPSSSPASKEDDNSYPGQAVPPAAVAAANARNQALESQQAQAQAQAQTQAQAQHVAVKQLDVVPEAPAPAHATPAAVSASPKAMQVPDSSSQQVVKAPSTPPPSNPSSVPESSSSYFSSSPVSSPSLSPQQTSAPSSPLPTSSPTKHDFTTNLNGTTSGKMRFSPSGFLLF